MSRKSVPVAALVIAAFAAGSSFTGTAGTAIGPENPVAEKGAPFVHCVIFHIKKDAPAGEAEALIADAHEMLSAIPSVRSLRAGKPAAKEKPDNARRDYQVGLLVLFNDLEGLSAYQIHPMHLKFVEKHGKYIEMEKLGVYDFVDQKK
jgi:hypothetical protein